MLQELTTTTETITTAIMGGAGGRGGTFLEQNILGELEYKQLHLVSDQLSASPLQ